MNNDEQLVKQESQSIPITQPGPPLANPSPTPSSANEENLIANQVTSQAISAEINQTESSLGIEVATKKGPWAEITQPFIDLFHAPRALWGVNISYLLEGLVYFGMVTLLTEYFSEYVGLSDIQSGRMVGFQTYGITLAMALFGGLADRWGVRIALILSVILMLFGRLTLAGGVSLGFAGGSMLSPLNFVAMSGILLIILGYGMYQPAAYAAVRQFTTPKTATMGYAMLYAVMNLGGWLPTFISPPLRKAHGIVGVYWAYALITSVTLIMTIIILTRRTVERATANAKAVSNIEGDGQQETKVSSDSNKPREPFSLWRWLKNHPLADPKFSYFIFALIPVQTLFAHNWLTLPQYLMRAYKGTWIGDNFEAATSFNSLLIFILVPIVASITQKRNVYNMMIAGTAVMASPTFLLALGPNPWNLTLYLILMTIGEAMWQPRFLQYATEIAPEGRSAAYMGVAQFPWFLTKFITSLYSGWFLSIYCPREGALNTETMWFIYGCIAISSTFFLLAAKGWIGKNFKTKA